MPVVVRRYLGRGALRNSDQRLVPAIVACNFSICFLIFGVFMTISGVIFRSIAANSTYDTTSNFTPSNGPSQTAVTVGTIILSVGAVLAAIGLVLLIFAMITFKRYESQRSAELQRGNSAANLNYETSFTNATVYPAPTPMSNTFGQPTNAFRSQRLYTIQDEFEPPPSYSTLPHNNHQVINQSDK